MLCRNDKGLGLRIAVILVLVAILIINWLFAPLFIPITSGQAAQLLPTPTSTPTLFPPQNPFTPIEEARNSPTQTIPLSRKFAANNLQPLPLLEVLETNQVEISTSSLPSQLSLSLQALQTLTVPTDGTLTQTNFNLSVGVIYLIRVSGTYVWGNCDPVNCPNGGPDYLRKGDAEYLTDSNWQNIIPSSGIPYFEVNGSNPNFGQFSQDHIYSIQIAGNGAPATFRIQDCSVCYGDNSGALTIEISLAATNTISGSVTGDNNQPLPDVAFYYTNATTDNNGNYIISGSVAGTYDLIPRKKGYVFSPPKRTVTVPPDAIGQNFSATRNLQQIPYEPVAEILDPTDSPDTGFVVRAVAEKDGFVYLYTREGYLYTYNLSELPNQQFFTTYDTPLSSQYIGPQHGGLLRNGDYIYAFGAYGDAGLKIIDIRNPAAPKVIRSRYDLGIFNLIQYNNYLIAAGLEKVAVYSISNPSSPTLLSTLYVGTGRRVWSAAVSGNVLYTSEAIFEDPKIFALRVINFSNPSNLSTIRVINRDTVAYHLRIVGNQLVECADYQNDNVQINSQQVRLWNLNTPSNPIFQVSKTVAGTRVCALDGNNIVINGSILHPNSNDLETIATFEPLFSQIDGMPYGSAITSEFVFIAQSPRILILKKTLADLTLEQSVEVTNKLSPYAPNNLTLEVKVKNQSGSVTVSNVTVTFYDGNPDSGGITIGSTLVGDLSPGVSKMASINWGLNGNIENHRVYARVSTSASISDPNPSNNTINRPLSVYYVDNFRHDVDAYSFSNGSDLGTVTGKDVLDFLKNLTDFWVDVDTPELYPPLVVPFLVALSEPNGYCYGMANSSIVYFFHPDLKPNPSKTTYNHTMLEARAKIRTYHWNQFFDAVKVIITPEPWEATKQYNLTLESIRQGRPVIHGLMERPGIWLPKKSHALVAYKIVDLGTEKRVFYYDNNFSKDALSNGIGGETYGVFTNSNFSEPFYPKFPLKNRAFFNKAYVFQHQLSLLDKVRSGELIWDLIKWLLKTLFIDKKLNVSSSGSGDLIAIDSFGRRVGYSEGQEYNEVPGAEIFKASEMQSLLLPMTGIYQFQVANGNGVISALNNTSISLDIVDPISETSGRVIRFQDIVVTQGQVVSVQFSHGLQEPKMTLPDGTKISPDANGVVNIKGPKIFLPLILR